VFPHQAYQVFNHSRFDCFSPGAGFNWPGSVSRSKSSVPYGGPLPHARAGIFIVRQPFVNENGCGKFDVLQFFH